MRLIDADALRKSIGDICSNTCLYPEKYRPTVCRACYLSDLKDLIESEPSIEIGVTRYGEMVFCPECGGKRAYLIISRITTSDAQQEAIFYVEKTAYCAKCGTEVYVPEINDQNAQAREEAARRRSKDATD